MHSAILPQPPKIPRRSSRYKSEVYEVTSVLPDDRGRRTEPVQALIRVEGLRLVWPKLLTRYVTAELLKVLLAALLVFTLLLTLGGVAQEAVRRGLGLVHVVRLLPYTLPNALVYALPGAMLFSVCSVFGRMSAAGEITAVKALGRSPHVFVRPAVMLAFGVSLVTVWLLDRAFSWSAAGIERVILESAEEIAYGVLRTERTYRTRQFSIFVAGVEGRSLLGATISFHGAGNQTVTMTAREARLHAAPQEGALQVTLTDGAVEVGTTAAFRFHDTIEQLIPLTGEANRAKRSVNPMLMPMRQIPGARQVRDADLRRREQQLAVDCAVDFLLGDFDELQGPRWTENLRWLDSQRQYLHRLEVEPYRRWSGGFSCLAFALLGAPLAIRLRNADVMTTFGICFLPILLVYYPLFAYGLDRAKDGALPPYCVWLGNLVCAAIGWWLLRRVVRR